MAADGSSGLTAQGAEIPNIDSVKSTIRDVLQRHATGIADKTSSPYISELDEIQRRPVGLPRSSAYDDADQAGETPAIVFDADDTTLWTYDMEDAAMHFNFDSVLQNEWVQDQRFPATPGMVEFVQRAPSDWASRSSASPAAATPEGGHGRQPRQGRLHGLQRRQLLHEVGRRRHDRAGLRPPATPTTTRRARTVEYKAGTRQHIEETSATTIVLNVGDQWSDLQGGYADTRSSCPTRPTTCRARTCRPRRPATPP